ncbi:uncharacterized protein LOC143034683 [Oratosquilla oratoria]|uniref:uncharacterized protein LOC143034683 n=1 Tax=Oratosquilla oratoria TaxID=337810 RepID=UPI003F772852
MERTDKERLVSGVKKAETALTKTKNEMDGCGKFSSPPEIAVSTMKGLHRIFLLVLVFLVCTDLQETSAAPTYCRKCVITRTVLDVTSKPKKYTPFTLFYEHRKDKDEKKE